MKRPSTVLLLVAAILFLSAPPTFGNEIYLSCFKAEMTSGEEIVGYEGTANPDSLVGVDTTGKPIVIDRDDIFRLYRRHGNQAAEGFALGAGAGLLVGVIYNHLRGDEAAPQTSSRKSLTNIAAFLVGGGVAGLLLGSTVPAWEKVQIPLEWSLDPNPDRPYLRFSIRF